LVNGKLTDCSGVNPSKLTTTPRSHHGNVPINLILGFPLAVPFGQFSIKRPGLAPFGFPSHRKHSALRSQNFLYDIGSIDLATNY